MVGAAALVCPGDAETAMKYEMVAGDTVVQDGRTLFRVRRLSDGLLGGYIEREDNLSQSGSSFLYNESRAFGRARIQDNAQVYGMVYDDAVIGGDARVYGEVFGHAQVLGHATVRGRVYDRAIVRDRGEVYGQAYGQSIVEGSAKVFGQIYGTARASGDEIIYGIRSR
jgi:hypothetical protein